jgi:hypothetical protein
MHPRRLCLFVTAFGCVTTELAGRSEERINALSTCAVDLQLPRSGPVGPEGEIIGPVVVTIVVDALGDPSTVTTEGGSDASAILVKSWVRGSTFSPKCSGKRLTFRISFVTEGPPIDYPFSWMTFRSPDHFVLHTRSRVPRVINPPGGSKRSAEAGSKASKK